MVDHCWESNGSCSVMENQKLAVPAPFLTKTYQLVDDPSTDHIVSWGNDLLSTFVVWRPPEFARDILPNYFKHNNFSSFVRQLNTYGFRKVVPERWEFANDFFRKGEKQLLCEINRRKTTLPSSCFPSPSSFPPLYEQIEFPNPISPPPMLVVGNRNATMPRNASMLLEENERLRRSNAALLSELAHMRKLYNDIIYFVQNHVRPVAATSFGGFYHKRKDLNSGSTTSSSSLTIAEEPTPLSLENSNGESSSYKLFGVAIAENGNSSYKRELHLNDATSPATKPHLVLDKNDLGFNLLHSS